MSEHCMVHGSDLHMPYASGSGASVKCTVQLGKQLWLMNLQPRQGIGSAPGVPEYRAKLGRKRQCCDRELRSWGDGIEVTAGTVPLLPPLWPPLCHPPWSHLCVGALPGLGAVVRSYCSPIQSHSMQGDGKD